MAKGLASATLKHASPLAATADSSVLGRMALVLNAFSVARPALTVEDVAHLLGASEATAYRYLGEL